MDREIRIGNRIIYEKMQQLRTKKHRQTLSMIKSRGSSLHNQTMYNQESPKCVRYSSGFLENKNLQIERQNIKLFNKIASIIRQKPKAIQTNSQHAHNNKDSAQKLKKRQQKIKTQNQIIEKRLAQQKPTIQNKQLYKDRLKNLKYLKILGRFPYDKEKRSSSQHQVSENLPTLRTQGQLLLPSDVQVYRKQIDDFFVQITRISNNCYVFKVEAIDNKKMFQMTMKKDMYEDQFMKCGYNYEKMISRLRLNENQSIIFDQISSPNEEYEKQQNE